MGVKQSKRSVDITETSTKGEIEGFGNEGKVEKIIDGVVEKVAANGHVEGDLQNGIEPIQNGVEVIQNGEAASVATEITEKKDVDESPVEGVVNGQVEVNGEMEKSSEEGKKSEEKKEKKKEKKEKGVKKKFSLRNFSFSKKDKSKPLKEEKSAEKVDEAETEEAVTSPENEVTSTTQEQLMGSEKLEESTKAVTEAISNETVTISPHSTTEMEIPSAEKIMETSTKMPEDLPPPLPASPPPSEPVEAKLAAEMDKVELSPAEKPSGEMTDVSSSHSNILTEATEMTKEAIKNAEQIAIETGKQIEEKATNLLKAVEERAGKEIAESQNGENASGAAEGKVETKEMVVDEAKTMEDAMAATPVEISNVGALSPKGEEATEKVTMGNIPVDVACCEPNADPKDICDI